MDTCQAELREPACQLLCLYCLASRSAAYEHGLNLVWMLVAVQQHRAVYDGHNRHQDSTTRQAHTSWLVMYWPL